MNQRRVGRVATLPEAQLIPREELFKPGKRNIKLNIGIPDNASAIEYRIPLTPQSVELLVCNGHEVYIQAGAGIVADSDPESEYNECCNKVRALAKVLVQEENL